MELPKGQKVVGCKWIFKRKGEIPGVQKTRYKARLVAKGFTQVKGVNYNEIFAPMVKHCSIIILMSIANQFKLHLEQLDVKTAFLHGDLEETIYMRQPEGFAVDDRVCFLQKSLYGLKQSPRQWYKKFDDFLIKMEFKRCSYDNCVYVLHQEDYLYLLLYVDDILVASCNKCMINDLKSRLHSEFEMKDLGESRRILGVDIKRDQLKGTLLLSQQAYMQKVVERFRMHQSKPVSTPLWQHMKLSKSQGPISDDDRKKMDVVPYTSGVGSIMYGMVCTRPDLAHAMSVVSRFMVESGQAH